MILYKYQCDTHGYFDALNTIEKRGTHPCPICEAESQKVLCASAIKLEGFSGHFPTAADKWTRYHETEGKRE